MARKAPAPTQVTLQFDQSLKGCSSNAELLKRCKALHVELADIDQELVDTASLDSIAKELISAPLLLHKDRGVKAYLACCLADILRLYAPEAPYTQNELKDLFQFLFRQLKYLTTASEPHFQEYFYLIESLSNVKSIVLICDLDSADELMAEIFKQSFDVISSNSPKNVEICVADMLMQLIEESPTLTPEVIETLLAQFLPKNAKNKPASYRLAVEVCTGASDRLQRYVCQYFAEVITSTVSGSRDSDESEDEGAKRGSKLAAKALPQDFLMAHALIKQVNRSVPSLLLNVIPQLEEELTAEKPEYRKLATEVVGAMIGEKMGQGDLAAKYPGTWKEWLGRYKDKVPVVRVAMVESLRKIWTEHPELGKDIEATMERVFGDHDDRVRAAAAGVFEDMDYETASHHVSKRMLVLLGERCTDKKSSIRAIAFKALARLYSLAFPEIESGDKGAIDHFAWIPGTIYSAVMFGDDVMQCSIRAAIDSVNLEYLLPLPKKDDDESAWVDRLLVVMQHLTDKQTTTFLCLTRLAEKRPGPYEAFIKVCEANNGGIIDENEEQIKAYMKNTVKVIVSRLSDQNKGADDLAKFAAANEKHLYKLFRILMDAQTDLKLMIKTYRECLRRLEQISSTIVDTFVAFIRNSCFLLVNRSSIPSLLKRVQSRSGADSEAQSRVAVRVLEYVSKTRPELYRTHVAELSKTLGEGSSEGAVTVALHAISRLVKNDGTTVLDKKLSDRAKHFAREGTPSQARSAATIIAFDTARPGNAEDLVDYLANSLEDASDSMVVSHMSALSRLARHAPAAYELKSEVITQFALSILMRSTQASEEVEDPEDDWVSDEALPDVTKSRILAIKTLTNRCLAFAAEEEATQVSEPVFQLLWPLVARGEETPYNGPTESRLRYAAALAILKLATQKAFQLEINKGFNLLARTAQDPCGDVRSGFIAKLTTYLREGKITSPRCNMILFLVAHDPDEDIRTEAAFFLTSRARRLPIAARQAQLEHPFVRLIHLLAHHPDFSGDANAVDEIKEMAKYIEMYITCIATQDNIPYLYHLALKLKTVRDSESSDFDTRIYILSDLSQHLFKSKSKAEGWAIPTHPHSVLMPSDVFKSLSDASVAKAIAGKSYIPASVLAEVGNISKPVKRKATTSKVKGTSTPAKRKAGKPRSAKKKPKKGEDWNSDASASASEPDLSSGSDSDAPVASKKSKSKTAAVVASKRAGLRGPRKGLMAPLAIEERGDKGEVSDLSDEEMEE